MQEKLDHYNLTMPLAKKYSHSTYLSSHIDEPERQVIVILLSPSLFPPLSERKAFLQKTQRLKELQHPHILPLLNVSIEGRQPFVVRDYLPNGSLRSYLKQLSPERLKLHDALNIVLQIGEALAYAHQQNIFHGNLKPENILFDTNSQAILTDFHLVSRKDVIIRNQTSEEYAFCYMAPEQFTRRTDAGSDQYALGCLTYELITGRLPFTTQSLASMMGQPNYTLPAPLSEHVADLPAALEAAILKTLAKDPAERFFDFSLFLDVIRSILPPQPVPTLSCSKTPRKRSVTPSYPTPPIKLYASFSSSRQFVASPRPKPKTSEVSVSSNAEHNLAEPVVTSTESSVPRLPSVNSLDDLFTGLLAASPPTHSSPKQVNTESPINNQDTVHELEVAEMILPLSSPDGRDGSLKRNLQRNRRIFWLMPLGCLIVALVIAAWNRETAFPSVPVEKSTPDVLVYQKPTQVTIQSLAPIAEPGLPTTATIQAKVPTPSTTPTTQSTMSSPTATPPMPTPTPTPVLQTTTVDDSVMGTGLNQFNYVGSGWQHGTECPGPNCRGTPPYDNTNSWSTEVNDYVTVSFSGVQIKFYGIIDVPHGIGAASIDGGPETMVDFYSSTREGNQLLWTSPMLPAGTHTFKMRVTGNKNPNASNTAVVVDRVDILS